MPPLTKHELAKHGSGDEANKLSRANVCDRQRPVAVSSVTSLSIQRCSRAHCLLLATNVARTLQGAVQRNAMAPSADVRPTAAAATFIYRQTGDAMTAETPTPETDVETTKYCRYNAPFAAGALAGAVAPVLNIQHGIATFTTSIEPTVPASFARSLDRRLTAALSRAEQAESALAAYRAVELPEEPQRWEPNGEQMMHETSGRYVAVQDYYALRHRLAGMTVERHTARNDKDEAYRQRNHLVAALAHIYPSGIRRSNIEGWSPDWHGCVYIDLPSGQISYHYHDSHAHLFADLPPYIEDWDGHDKETVHQRLGAIRAMKEGA
jgi:hypothetical protein